MKAFITNKYNQLRLLELLKMENQHSLHDDLMTY